MRIPSVIMDPIFGEGGKDSCDDVGLGGRKRGRQKMSKKEG